MGKNQTKISWRHLLVSLVLLGFACWYWVAFGSGNAVFAKAANATMFSKTFVALNVVKAGLSLLTTAAILWALLPLVRRKGTVSDGVKIWLMALVGGFLIICLTLMRGKYLVYTSFYDQAFMISRGAFPFITGLIALTLILPWLKKLAADRRFQLLGVILLSIPLLFNRDVFGLNNPLSLWGMIALGAAALIIANDDAKLSFRWFWLLGIAAVVTLVWIAAAAGRGVKVTSALRLLNPMSPFLVLPAMALVKWLDQITSAKAAAGKLDLLIQATLFESALLLSQGVYARFAASQFQGLHLRLTFLGPLWSLAAAVFFAAVAFVLTAFARWLLGLTRTWQQLDRYWGVDVLSACGLWLDQGRTIAKRMWHHYWRPAAAFCTLYAVQTISSLLMNTSLHTVENLVNANLSIFPVTFFSNVSRMLVGTMVLMAAYWLLLALTNRYWVSLLSVSTLALVFAIANRVKILARNEPINPSDLSELNNLPELVGMVSPVLLGGAVLGIVLIIALIVVLERHAHSAQQSWPARLSKLAVSLAFIFSLGHMNASFSPLRNFTETMGLVHNPNMMTFSQISGPVMQFVSQLDVKVMNQPQGYSKQNVDRLVKKYTKTADQINQTRPNTLHDQTIMFNLSESFSNPSRVPGLKLSKDPMPYIHSLDKQATSGYMMSFGYGGGTADMEWMTLTGLNMGSFDPTLQTPYTQLVTRLKQDPTIGSYFSYKSAIHPYRGGFYNRPAVYRKFKFNKFAHLDSKYPIIDQKAFGKSPYLSDTTAYANGLQQINARKGGQFINLITIQNHMPFVNDWYGPRQYTVSGKGFAQSQKVPIENYTMGIHETDKAVKVFKNEIDKIKKPIVWVFYGDHLAALYQSQNQVALHATDYFVYANKYARAHGAKTKLTGTSKYVAPSDFIALAAEQAGAKVNAYVALLTKVQKQLPSEWIKAASSQTSATYGTRFVTDSGKTLNFNQLSKKQQALFHDYQLIQYDITKGGQYSLAAGMQKRS